MEMILYPNHGSPIRTHSPPASPSQRTGVFTAVHTYCSRQHCQLPQLPARSPCGAEANQTQDS